MFEFMIDILVALIVLLGYLLVSLLAFYFRGPACLIYSFCLLGTIIRVFIAITRRQMVEKAKESADNSK
jgi:hypothetical protein